MKIDTLKQYYVSSRFVLFAVSTDKDVIEVDEIVSTAQDGLLDSTSIDKVEFPFKVKFSEIGINKMKIGIKEYILLANKDTTDEYMRNLKLRTICNRVFYVKDSI